MKKSIIALVAICLASAGSGLWWWQRGGDEAPVYRTAPLERGVLQASVTASGTVNPVTQVSGQIRAIHVDFNSEVKGGRPADRRDRPPDL